MSAVVEPLPAQDFPALKQWLSYAETTRRIIQEKYSELIGPARLTATIQENVLAQMENLRTHPVIASNLAQGKLKLHGWVYKIESGDVYGYDPNINQFQLLSEHRYEFPIIGRQLIPVEI
jgi:carbonic anhydrase